MSDNQTVGKHQQDVRSTSAQSFSSSRRGKVSRASFPPEIELFRFIEGLTNTDPTWNASTPACKWSGIRCCDPTRPQDVTDIVWQRLELCGTPNWKYLPESVLFLNLFRNALTGNLPLNVLPRNLGILCCGENELNGAFEVEHMPDLMVQAYLFINNLCGTLDLSLFPSSLENLSLSQNHLFGPLDFSLLATNLIELNLSINKFTGTIDLGHLPSSLVSLYLDNNRFVSIKGLNSLPEAMVVLHLAYNEDLKGEFRISSLPLSLRRLTDTNFDIRETQVTYLP